jgi:hypothetical protein
MHPQAATRYCFPGFVNQRLRKSHGQAQHTDGCKGKGDLGTSTRTGIGASDDDPGTVTRTGIGVRVVAETGSGITSDNDAGTAARKARGMIAGEGDRAAAAATVEAVVPARQGFQSAEFDMRCCDSGPRDGDGLRRSEAGTPPRSYEAQRLEHNGAGRSSSLVQLAAVGRSCASRRTLVSLRTTRGRHKGHCVARTGTMVGQGVCRHK